MRENGFRLPDYLQRAHESHIALAATQQQQQQQQRSKRALRQQQPAKQKSATAATTVTAGSLTAALAVALDARDALVVAGESADAMT
jgi:acetoin utilization deacetylase AcuC-like enzyme